MVSKAYAGRIFLWGGLYFVAAQLSLIGPIAIEEGPSLVWLPAGVGLGLVIRCGYRYWPAIALGSILSIVGASPPAAYVSLVTASHVLEALLGAFLFLRLTKCKPELRSVRDVICLFVLGGVATGLTSVLLSPMDSWFVLSETWNQEGPLMLTGWLERFMGVVIVAPAALVILRRPFAGFGWRQQVRSGATAGLVLFFLALFLSFDRISWQFPYLLEIAAFPFLVWIALRFGTPGAALANLFVFLLVLLGSNYVLDSVPMPLLFPDLLRLPGLIFATSMTSLVVGSAIDERTQSAGMVGQPEAPGKRPSPVLSFPMTVRREGDDDYLEGHDSSQLIAGFQQSEVVGKTVVNLGLWTHDWEETQWTSLLHNRGNVKSLDVRYRSRTGELRQGLLSAEMVRVGGEDCVLAVSRDVTEQMHAIEALRESEKKLQSLMQHSNDIITVLKSDGTILYESPSVERILGYRPDELVGQKISSLLRADDVTLVQQHAEDVLKANGSSKPIRYHFRAKDGTWRILESISRAILEESSQPKIISNSRDVTKIVNLEEKLTQAQKMEAVGRLAGGIAHDFNNLLMVISGYAEILSAEVPQETGAGAKVQQIQDAAAKATSLTRQLLAFGRKQVMHPQVVNLSKIVAGMDDILRRLIGEDIHLMTTWDPGPTLVIADPNQMDQIILNLAVNARDAMPTGGSMTISACQQNLDEPLYAWGGDEIARGSYVVLQVQDTGNGIDESIMPNLFEPFFTTKEVGKGTGLGLSTVYGIVKQSGGFILVESAPGRGSTFKVFFPSTEGAEQREKSQSGVPGRRRGSGTILLVEDEAAVREVTAKFLEQVGYRVLKPADVTGAVSLAKTHKGNIHLILADVTMPLMSGPEVVSLIQQSQPRARVLYMSGYTPAEMVEHGGSGQEATFIQKPFSMDELLKKVRKNLDNPSS